LVEKSSLTAKLKFILSGVVSYFYHGANMNAKDDNGKTPLTIALEYKQPEMANVLRDHKAVE
jgi:ankyrin repeat protein